MNIKEFKKDLKKLLNDHGATLCAEYDGDTHGIFNEKFVVYSKEDKCYVLNEYSTCISENDI